jgi:ribonuclease P protein component
VASRKSTGLKRSSDFLRLKTKGKKRKIAPWLLLQFKENDLGHLRFGITASRQVGVAVVRNRLKRWVRDFFRNEKKLNAINGFDINLVFLPIAGSFYKELKHQDFSATLRKGIEDHLVGRA